jgi:hypothetical protein
MPRRRWQGLCAVGGRRHPLRRLRAPAGAGAAAGVDARGAGPARRTLRHITPAALDVAEAAAGSGSRPVKAPLRPCAAPTAAPGCCPWDQPGPPLTSPDRAAASHAPPRPTRHAPTHAPSVPSMRPMQAIITLIAIPVAVPIAIMKVTGKSGRQWATLTEAIEAPPEIVAVPDEEVSAQEIKESFLKVKDDSVSSTSLPQAPPCSPSGFRRLLPCAPRESPPHAAVGLDLQTPQAFPGSPRAATPPRHPV